MTDDQCLKMRCFFHVAVVFAIGLSETQLFFHVSGARKLSKLALATPSNLAPATLPSSQIREHTLVTKAVVCIPLRTSCKNPHSAVASQHDAKHRCIRKGALTTPQLYGRACQATHPKNNFYLNENTIKYNDFETTAHNLPQKHNIFNIFENGSIDGKLGATFCLHSAADVLQKNAQLHFLTGAYFHKCCKTQLKLSLLSEKY